MLTTRVTSDILLEKYKSYGASIAGSVFEFEAKIFTSFSSGENVSRGERAFRVSKAHWDNLFATCLNAKMRMEVRWILTVQFQNQDFRMRLTSAEGSDLLLFETENKYRLYNYDDPISWVRYSFSQEKSLTKNQLHGINALVLKKILLPELVLEEGELDERALRFGEGIQTEVREAVAYYHADSSKRLAHRTSFYPANFPWARIDMSEVTNETGEIEYDVEVEMLNATENMRYVDLFYRLCKRLVCSFRGSDNFYDRVVYRAICELINSHCYPVDPKTGIQGNYIYKQIFNQVRTIKKDDLAQGGIVGGKTSYSVTYKSDGYRTVLGLTPYGVWAFMIPITYNLILRTTFFSIDDITIIDGELIPKEKRDESTHEYEYYYEAFDAIFVRGRDVRSPPLAERCRLLWDYLKAIDVDELFGKKMRIRQKLYREIHDVNDLFEQTEKMLDHAKTRPIRTDGLIFAPSEPSYTIGIEVDTNNTERTLLTHNEIVKWKNPKDTTIDLRLRIYEGKRRLLGVEWEVVDDKKEPKEIPFEGDAQYPFDQDTMVDWEQLEDVEEGTIGEYGWNFEEKKLQFLRARDVDKQHPNTISAVAIPNWREIQFPIREEAITGRSFALMFYYHLRIKGRLLENNSGGSFKTLLDIGTGRGALLWYWKLFERIIASEPNAKHREEFKRRCVGLGLPVFDSYGEVPTGTKRFVVLLPYRAQDTDQILEVVNEVTGGKKVDVVSLMDVGTFLWETPEILRQSVKTIQDSLRKGGRFVWKMMNGDIVRQSLSIETEGKTRFKLGKFYLNYEVVEGEIQKQVGVYIPGSITTEGGDGEVQEEWLTSVTELCNLFTDTNEYYVTSRERATAEQVMSENEKTLSAWFEYGVIEKNPQQMLENEQIVAVAPPARGGRGGRGGRVAVAARGGRGGRAVLAPSFSRVRTTAGDDTKRKQREVPLASLDASGL